MVSKIKMKRNSIKLSQVILQIDKMISSDSYIDIVTPITTIFDSDFDVNFEISMDSPLKYLDFDEQYLQGINCTVLHFIIVKAFYSCRMHDVKRVLQLFLNRGANFTRKDHQGFTPLLLAFNYFKRNSKEYWNNYESVFNVLLTAHCEFNDTTNAHCSNGISHFHLACFTRNVRVVKFFLDDGVPLNEAIDNNSDTWPGYTALHIAMRNKDKVMVQLLVQHGAFYNNAIGLSPMHLLNDKQFESDLFSEVSLSIECKSLENKYILDMLSETSADNFNPIDYIGLTKLHVDCIRKSDPCELNDLKEHLNSHVDVNAAVNFCSPVWPGSTPLHFATHCNLQMVMLLLEKGANLLSKDANGITPLDLCLNKYAPTDISCILKTQNSLESITFPNCAQLIRIICLFESANKMRHFLEIVTVNITLPFDSPLWPGFSLLHLAVLLAREDTSYVKLCLEHGADFTIQDANKMTALHLAFRLKKQECVSEILDAHVNNSANPADDKSVSHFHIACAAGHVKSVENFLRNGIHPDMPIQAGHQDVMKMYFGSDKTNHAKVGSTALQNTIFLDSKELPKLLLEYKADPHLPDADGFTWIHRVFMHTNFRLHEYDDILWSRAETLKSNLTAPGGLSYLHIACCTGNLAAVKALLPLVENINEPITSDSLKYYKKLPDFVSLGDTPLHFAVTCKKNEVAIMLVKNGGDLSAKNEIGLTPMHKALMKFDQSFKLAKTFSESFFDWKVSDEFGMTRLHVACALHDVPRIKQFLEDGDDPDSKINFDSPVWPGCAPFELFIQVKWTDPDPEVDSAIKLLIGRILKNVECLVPVKQDLEAKRRKLEKKSPAKIKGVLKGLNAFHFSCTENNPDIVEKFIKCGLDVDALGSVPADCNSDNYIYGTALHFATYHGNKEIIEVLLTNKADISLEDANGQTPLHVAALMNPSTLETFFRLRKIDVKMKNAFGESIIDCLFQNEDARSDDFLRVLGQDSAKDIDLSTKMKVVRFLARKFSGNEFVLLIKCLSNLKELDASGRSIIHHFSSDPTCKLKIEQEQFAHNIEFLLNYCQLDHQDDCGKTPLHLAVQNNNLECVEAFLSLGADVNITDNHVRTAYACCRDAGNLFEVISEHICKMIEADLHVQKIDKTCSCRYDSSEKKAVRKSCLGKMKELEIIQSFSLRDVLSDKLLKMFPAMPLHQRHAIMNCFVSDEFQQNFSEWIPLFKMQLRKALKREKFFNSVIA